MHDALDHHQLPMNDKNNLNLLSQKHWKKNFGLQIDVS